VHFLPTGRIGGFSLLRFLRIIISVIVIFLAGYGLVSGNFGSQPIMMLSLGIAMLLMGIEEFQKGQRGYGLVSILVFLFIFLVTINQMVDKGTFSYTILFNKDFSI
jgi:Protein of unknown function (DUF3953)